MSNSSRREGRRVPIRNLPHHEEDRSSSFLSIRVQGTSAAGQRSTLSNIQCISRKIGKIPNIVLEFKRIRVTIDQMVIQYFEKTPKSRRVHEWLFGKTVCNPIEFPIDVNDGEIFEAIEKLLRLPAPVKEI